jgi:hypothetical protein
MQHLTFHRWSELQGWLARHPNNQRKFAFRGQSSGNWDIRTSLARSFADKPIKDDEWRRRELKMYQMFRERLRDLCPGMYDNWSALNILSLMQHHGICTRLLDFTFHPGVAAYFALRKSRGESAIWVVDCEFLEERRKKLKLPPYCGPTHDPKYTKLLKKHHLGGAIVEPEHLHTRLAAQRGCFLNTGSISMPISEELFHSKINLAEGLVTESLRSLAGQGIDHASLFPKLKRLAREVNRFATTGNPDFPSAI